MLGKCCNLKDALGQIRADGATISLAELRKIADEADVPKRRGAGRTYLYLSDALLAAFWASFTKRETRLNIGRHRRVKR